MYRYCIPTWILRVCLTLPSFISFIVATVIIASVLIAITFAKPLLLAETEGIKTDVQGGHALTFLKTVGTPGTSQGCTGDFEKSLGILPKNVGVLQKVSKTRRTSPVNPSLSRTKC